MVEASEAPAGLVLVLVLMRMRMLPSHTRASERAFEAVLESEAHAYAHAHVYARAQCGGGEGGTWESWCHGACQSYCVAVVVSGGCGEAHAYAHAHGYARARAHVVRMLMLMHIAMPNPASSSWASFQSHSFSAGGVSGCRCHG